MNKNSKLALSLFLIFSVIILPFFTAPVTEAADVVKQKTLFSTNYDNESSNADYIITTSPDSDPLRGKVAFFSEVSDKVYQQSAKNSNKIVVSFDALAEASSASISVRLRKSDGKEFTVGTVKFAGDISAGEWYKVIVTLNYADNEAEIVAVDSAGARTEFTAKKPTLGTGITPTHFRLRLTGSLYFDNYHIEEDVIWPQIDKITGSDGELNPVYTNNRLILTMTQNMKTVTPSDITIVNNTTKTEVPAETVTVSGNRILITTSTPLLSSTGYTLTLSGNALMSYSSLPLEDDMTVDFTTSSRPLDITDVSFTSDGNDVSYEVSYTNTTGADKDIVLVASGFDQEGRLTQTTFQAVTVGYEAPIAKSQGTLTVPENGSVKVFAIETFASVKNLNNIIYTYRLN